MVVCVSRTYSEKEKKNVRFKLYNTDTAKVSVLSDRIVRSRIYDSREEYYNLTTHGGKVFMGINNRVNEYGWYCKKGVINKTYKYVIVIGVDSGRIEYVAESKNGDIIHNKSTLEEMVEDLQVNIKAESMIIYNGVLEEISYDMYSLKYGDEYIEREYTRQVREGKELFKGVYSVDINVNDGKIEVVDFEHNGVNRYRMPERVNKISKFNGGVAWLGFRGENIEIGEEAMMGLEDIARVTLTKDAIVRESAFKESSLFYVDNMELAKVIEKEAFCGSKLTGDIEIRAEEIGASSFEMTSLNTVVINGTKRIRLGAFRMNSKLKSVHLETGVEYIHPFAFQGTSIREVSIPRTCRVVGKKSFDDCRKLRDIYIYRETHVEDGAFPKKAKVHYLN